MKRPKTKPDMSFLNPLNAAIQSTGIVGGYLLFLLLLFAPGTQAESPSVYSDIQRSTITETHHKVSDWADRDCAFGSDNWIIN